MAPQMSETTAATFCATLVDEWVRAGVTDAVICPGSRSTPMAIALANDDRLRLQVHHDERAAAFVALGMGIASGVPAVVLTTSGTAAVELHPAVVEAHHAKVPMLAVTADRPPELHDVGAPQTIDQAQLFGAVIRAHVDPGVPDELAAGQWRSVASRAVLATTSSPGGPGPVHVNLPFREPLVGVPGVVPPGRPEGGPWHGRATAHPDATALDVDALADAVRGRRGLLVAGPPVLWPEAVHALASLLRWPVLADPRSGCRLPREASVSHFDALLRAEGFAERQRPEIVLRLGSLPVSKVLNRWLSELECWQVGIERDGTVYDPDRTLNSLLAVEPSALCEAMAGALHEVPAPAAPDGWYESWVHADAEAASVVREVLCRHDEPTEPAIARDVVDALPDGAALFVSSSMPIRDVESYAAPREGLRFLANRGANGIDGVVSTAVGVALSTRVPTGVLIGDVGLLHDTNALLGLASRPVDMCIVVVHNDGGGIFEFLPPATALERDTFEQLFGTPHGVDVASLADAHGIPCREVTRQAELGDAVRAALSGGGAHLIVARTDRRANVHLHADLHATIRSAVDTR